MADTETLYVQITRPRVVSPRGVAVLLPGPVGSAFALRHVTRALADSGYQVLVIDPLGMGRSSRPERADYALSQQALRVQAAIDSIMPLGTRYVLAAVGTSATIGLHLAANRPHAVRGVVSVAGGGNDTQHTSGLRFALTFSRLLNTSVGRALGRRKFASTAREQSGDPSWVTDDAVSGYLRDVERDVGGLFGSLRRMAKSEERQPIGPRLPEVAVPVILLVGDKPEVNAPTHAQKSALHSGLRCFREDTLPGAGAMLHEERPDAIVQRLIAIHRFPYRTCTAPQRAGLPPQS